jgi:DNA-binding transcriptional LysR family regulator
MTKALDRITLLETFVRIAERGSISAAARDLGLSQPSVSRQLAELEHRFSAQLARRTTHELSLTPAGLDLLGDARQLIDNWTAMTERHGRGKTDIGGRLKIVAPVALGQLHLADVMLQFQNSYPKVSIDWHLEDEPIRFAETGCDCWIKVGTVPDDSLIVRPLAQVERLVVAAGSLARQHIVKTPSDLEKVPFTALDPFDGAKITLKSKTNKSQQISPDVAVATNNIFALHRAALMGAGAAVLPLWFVEDDLKAGRLTDILPGWRAPTLTINIAYLPGRHQPIRLKKFIDHLYEGIAGLPVFA